jgi:hypothetical protein
MSKECQPSSMRLLPNGQAGPVKETRTFRPLTQRKWLPIRSRKVCGHVAHFQPAHANPRNVQDDRFITSNCHHVWLLLDFQPVTQFGIATINTISHNPRDLDLSLQEALQHEDGQLRFGAEGDRLGNPSLLAAYRIVRPVVRKTTVPGR